MFGCADRYVDPKVLRIMVQFFKTSVYYMKACHTNMTEQTNIAKLVPSLNLTQYMSAQKVDH